MKTDTAAQPSCMSLPLPQHFPGPLPADESPLSPAQATVRLRGQTRPGQVACHFYGSLSLSRSTPHLAAGADVLGMM